MEPLSLRHVLALLAELHGVPPIREAALKARFQHLQKIGFPAETKTGRGKPASYTVPAIVKIVVAFEAMACGLLPERAAAFTSGMAKRWLSHAAAHAGWRILTSIEDSSRNQYFVFDPNGLVLLKDGHEEPEALAWNCGGFDRNELAAAIAESDSDMVDQFAGMERRFTSINVTLLLVLAAIHLEESCQIPRAVFAEALQDWGRANEWSPPDD